MRRIVAALVGLAVACTATLGAFIVIGVRLMTEEATRFPADQQPTEREIEASQRIYQIANSLELAVGPLAAGALVAVIVILALLAFRWELRRATRSV
jgi:hypothetical protein